MIKLTKYQLIWQKSIRLIIISIIKEKLNKTKETENINIDKTLEYDQHLRWRLALNLYLVGNYEESCILFHEITIEEKMINNRYHNQIISFIYQTAGRCNVQMFLKAFDHLYIEVSYKYYKNAVENLNVNFFTVIKLPILLLEFGRVLEYYGAFEAANDIYTRILTSFPNFKGYFDALYRSAIIGKYLSNLMSDLTTKEESINKCIDILQFLLEALPNNISEIEVLLLFGRTLEMSTNPQIKFRANAIYRSLYDICRRSSIANANNVDTIASWLSNPNSWLLLADYITNIGESLIAKDAYDKYLEMQQVLAKKTKLSSTTITSNSNSNNNLSDRLSVESCLKLAKNAAQFQNYNDAVKYCELGLQVDKYNKQLRTYISKLSNTHALQLQHENNSLHKILNAWKGRCWTQGFRKKLKEKIIKDYEERYNHNRFDLEARENLAYYAKNIYRSQFLFEENCIIKIQKYYRKYRLKNMWFNGQCNHYSKKATEICLKFQKYPLSLNIRKEILDLCNIRIVSMKLSKHHIHKVKKIIDIQNNAIHIISNSYRSYCIRNNIYQRMLRRKHKEHMKTFNAVISIQRIIRKFFIRKEKKYIQSIMNQRIHAATIIQKFIRKRNTSLYHLAHIYADKVAYRIKRSYQIFKKKLLPIVLGYLTRKQFHINLKKAVVKRKTKIENNKLKKLAISVAINRLAGLIKAKVRVIRMKKALADIRNRNRTSNSIETKTLFSLVHMNYSQYQYHVPGINPNNLLFQTLSKQKTIYCNQLNGFTIADCMMLSIVIRSNISQIQELILHNMNNIEFEIEILNICRKSSSLRSIHLIGGNWRSLFIKDLIYIIKVENPRINILMIDKIYCNREITNIISTNIGYLLLDYFNYSIPGIKKLCLHDCLLTNINIELLAKGLEVNTSIECLILSLNLIDDYGFILLFYSIYNNNKTKINFIDISSNLIKDQDQLIQTMFKQYEPLRLDLVLTIYLIDNPMKLYYYPNSSKNLFIIYTINELECSNKKYISHSNNNNYNVTNNKLIKSNKKLSTKSITYGSIKQSKSLSLL